MKRAFCVAPALLLTACGGGGSATSALPAQHGGGSSTPSSVTVTAKITVPASGMTSNRALRRIYDTASATQGILLTVYPASSPSSDAITVTGADISASSPNCTANANGRVCTVSFPAPPGNNNALLAQTYTQVIPPSGAVPGSAQALAAGSVALTIVPSSSVNTVNLTLNPVLASVNLTLVPASLRSLLPATFGLNVVGLDASGSVIVAGQYVDAAGNPVSASLLLGSNPNNSVTLSTSTVSVPGTTVTGTYNGDDDVAGNASASIAITSLAPFAASAALTVHGPTVTAMASAQPNLAGTPPPYANALLVNVNGNDPQIWYTGANGGSTCLANYDVANANGACATASPGPAGLSTDGSTYVYAAGATAPFYYQFNPLGFLGQDNSCTTYCASASGSAYSPTTNVLYYTDTSGNIAELVNPAGGGNGAQPAAMALSGTPEAVEVQNTEGIDSVWYLSSNRLLAESGGSGVIAPSPPSGMLDMYVAPTLEYVTVPQSHSIVVFNDSTLAVSQSYPTAQGAPQYLVGSSDGNSVWFSETTAAGLGIGRIDVVNQRLHESQITTGGGIAGGIALNPNSDAIYILEWSGTASAGYIYRVTP